MRVNITSKVHDCILVFSDEVYQVPHLGRVISVLEINHFFGSERIHKFLKLEGRLKQKQGFFSVVLCFILS